MLTVWASLLTYFPGGIFLLAAAFLALWLTPERLNQVESWPRNRWVGMILGWVALILCVPHAQPIAFDFLQPYLWPIALVAPILGFFFLDYLTARSLGGLIIFYGFYLVHLSFETNLNLAPALAVVGWLIGAVGIWMSGKPCALRDWLRRCAQSHKYARIWALFLIICGALSLAGGVEFLAGLK